MKSQYFFIGKELYESILIIEKLWLILSVIPLFSLTRYLILAQIVSHHSSNNTKYLILLRILINSIYFIEPNTQWFCTN